jgi:hypothetical protein
VYVITALVFNLHSPCGIQHPFAAGITLAGFNAVSVDENWNAAFIESTAGAIHKVMTFPNNAVDGPEKFRSCRICNLWRFILIPIPKAWLGFLWSKHNKNSLHWLVTHSCD